MLNPKRLIDVALREDLGPGDITTRALFPKNSPPIKAKIIAKQNLVIAGLEIAEAVFKKVDANLRVKKIKKDGARVKSGAEILFIHGKASSILTAERTALNFLQHLSGVATLTSHFVEKIHGTHAKILDTRKTLPGWRALEKYAVKIGEGKNHRMGLYDAYLIKDNHLALYGSITKAIEQVQKTNLKKLKIEVEVNSLKQFKEALAAKPDWILLDNMTLEDMRLAVIRRNQVGANLVFAQNKGRSQGSPLLEASGNINLHNVRSVAQTGVDYISIGALTHSAPAVDMSLEI